MLAAGVDIFRVLEQVQKHPPHPSYRRPVAQVQAELQSGRTFAESLRQVSGWLPEFDIAVLHAGEQSGRLDACFNLLSDYYNDRARLARQVIGDLAYPAALFHMAIFIFPFSAFFVSGNWIHYLVETFGVLIPLYALAALVIYATQSKHGEKWRSIVESTLRPVPVLGTARSYLALSRLAAALEALLNAGVTIVEAWAIAATASGSPSLRRVVSAWRPQLDAGRTPAELVSTSYRFPEVFSSQYASGEMSGKLDDTLRRLQKYYNEEGSRKLHAVAQWSPRIVYLFVALMIGYKVVSFWVGYFDQVKAAGGF